LIYRPLGGSGVRVSQLGFGAMRLPLKDENDFATIDEPRSDRMIRSAIDKGVNYLDTAYVYHRGASETYLGEALRNGYREKIFLATKSPVWLLKSREDAMKYLNEQLTRLRVDTVDFYLLHGLNQKSWKTVKDLDVLGFLDRARESGKIRWPGFSFHDDPDLFREIVDAYSWTLCQVHLNYVDDDCQAGIAGMEYAHKKGLGVVVMEPLRGGKLVRNVPVEVNKIINRLEPGLTPVEFALRFLFNRSETSCVLSGMSTIEQVEENLRIAGKDYVGSLSSENLADYAAAKAVYKSRTAVSCTGCGYCLPCPQNLPIPFILELYNDAYMYDARDECRGNYRVFFKPEQRADKCTACGECESKCPQKIPIAATLAEVNKVLQE
jgi:predicted aldo/keto reductase-like oxidoreductase